ncbi:DUF4256 domain-containing protein [Miniphocaeibacter massiliensis]|uniref:DUF4256 domain-containing protein n=1 Tax=Miniphocaeibacter massiliensis TaxID=2041841 RepID=UPI000C07E9DD|nr:DUF4256 domain-containing protein [Miniphocaeibacter massiliensis]
MKTKKILDREGELNLLEILEKRFKENMHRHNGVKWQKVLEKLKENPSKLNTLSKMEKTGGEPDVVKFNSNIKEYVFVDFSKETPEGRRSLCYDKEALESRKKNKPENSALEMAKEIGIEILTEEEYRRLQKVEELDLKTSSWVFTPKEIRELKGALFCDRRYNHVFLYHNGVESYYSSRGFRGKLRV